MMVMVDMKTRMAARGQDQPPENLRNTRRQRRLQVLKDVNSGRQQMVSVVPSDEKYRAVLKHLPSGIAFRKDGGALWPNDKFTQRRLRDGSVKLEAVKKEEKAEDTKPAASSTSAPRSTAPSA
jgi:hypothetical protein